MLQIYFIKPQLILIVPFFGHPFNTTQGIKVEKQTKSVAYQLGYFRIWDDDMNPVFYNKYKHQRKEKNSGKNDREHSGSRILVYEKRKMHPKLDLLYLVSC